MLKCFYKLTLLVLFSSVVFAKAIEYHKGMANREYAQKTDEAYWDVVRPHQRLMEKLGKYVDSQYKDGSDMHQLYNNITAIESLTHDNNFVSKRSPNNTIESNLDVDPAADKIINIVAYTDNLFALVCGAKVRYDTRQSSSEYGKISETAEKFGANHGISETREVTSEDAQLMIAAMIHSRLSESDYAADHLPTNDYMAHNSINGILATNDRLKMHRLRIYAFQLLTGGMEYALNKKAGAAAFKSPLRRTLTNKQTVEDSWNSAVEFVQELFTSTEDTGHPWLDAMRKSSASTGYNAFANKGLPDISFEARQQERANLKIDAIWKDVKATLEAYKNVFIDLYTPISNIASDRKFRLYRKIPQHILDDERAAAKASLAKTVKNLDEKATDLKDEDISLGDKLASKKKDKIRFKLVAGANYGRGVGGISFSDIGGAYLYKTSHALRKVPSVIIPYYPIDKEMDIKNINKQYMRELILSKDKRHYIVLQIPPGEDEQSMKKLFRTAGVYVFSTKVVKKGVSKLQSDVMTIGEDGAYAYIPAGVMGNKRTTFEMIAAPIGNYEIRDSIGVTNPAFLTKVAKSLSVALKGKSGEKLKKLQDDKVGISEAPIEVKTRKKAQQWQVLNNDMAVPTVTLMQLKAGSKHKVDKLDGGGYVLGFSKLRTEAKKLSDKGKLTKTSATVTVSDRKVIKIPKSDYEALKDGLFFTEGDLVGKTLDQLLDKEEGFFQIFGRRLYYIHKQSTDKGATGGYKLYWLKTGKIDNSSKAMLTELTEALGGGAKVILDNGN